MTSGVKNQVLGFEVCSCKRRASTQGGRGRRAARKLNPTPGPPGRKRPRVCAKASAGKRGEQPNIEAMLQESRARARTRANSIRRGTRGAAAIERATTAATSGVRARLGRRCK